MSFRENPFLMDLSKVPNTPENWELVKRGRVERVKQLKLAYALLEPVEVSPFDDEDIDNG